MIGIYKITNKLNGKSYIGQSIHCNQRIEEHCRGKKQFIDETIQLEGKENFDFELLEECEKDQLNEREDYYIAKYNTMFPSGYNKRWNTSYGQNIAHLIALKTLIEELENYVIKIGTIILPIINDFKVRFSNLQKKYVLLEEQKLKTEVLFFLKLWENV